MKENNDLVDNAIAVQANVIDSDQVARMVDKPQGAFGRIDILVNNAMVGRYFLKPFLE